MWDLIVSVPDHCLSFHLASANWENCFLSNAVNEAWSSFKDIFMEILNSVAPVKGIRSTRPIINLTHDKLGS